MYKCVLQLYVIFLKDVESPSHENFDFITIAATNLSSLVEVLVIYPHRQTAPLKKSNKIGDFLMELSKKKKLRRR